MDKRLIISHEIEVEITPFERANLIAAYMIRLVTIGRKP